MIHCSNTPTRFHGFITSKKYLLSLSLSLSLSPMLRILLLLNFIVLQCSSSSSSRGSLERASMYLRQNQPIRAFEEIQDVTSKNDVAFRTYFFLKNSHLTSLQLNSNHTSVCQSDRGSRSESSGRNRSKSDDE